VSSSYGLRVASNDIREIVGRYVTVTFEIVDRRYMDPDAAKAYKEAGKEKSGEEGEDVQDSGDSLESGLGDVPRRRRGERRYAVSLTLGSNALDPLVTEVYDAPGVYTLEFDLPRPMLTTIVSIFLSMMILYIFFCKMHVSESGLILYSLVLAFFAGFECCKRAWAVFDG
jgi:hypothetical protein